MLSKALWAKNLRSDGSFQGPPFAIQDRAQSLGRMRNQLLQAGSRHGYNNVDTTAINSVHTTNVVTTREAA